MTTLKASIIIRAYNAEKTIVRAIESAINQDFSKDQFEIIIVNDGSTDKTKELLERYAFLQNISIFHQENKGAVHAANQGIAVSKGIYISFVDSDDMVTPSFLNELVSFLDVHSMYDAIYSDYIEEVDGIKKNIAPRSLSEALLGGMLFRKKLLKDMGGFSHNTIFPEYDLFLKTMDRYTYHHYQKTLYIYMRHGGSVTANSDRVKSAIAYFQKTYPDKMDFINSIRAY